MPAGGFPELERARRLNQRHIPWAFTDLLSAAIQCLPNAADHPPALSADLRRELASAVCACDHARAADWPEAARDLLARCRQEAAADRPVIPGQLIRAATECDWSLLPARAWRARADCGEGL